MPTLYDLKPRFQTLLRPLVAGFAGKGVTANQITLAAIAISAIYGALVLAIRSEVMLLLLGPVLLVRMALNAMDGMLAREHDQATVTGAKLNEIGDVLADCFIYLPLAVFISPAWAIFLAVLTGVLTEFAGVVALAHGDRRTYDGPFGKSDRAVFFTLAAAFQVFLHFSAPAATAVFLAATAAGLLTIFNRLLHGADHV